MKIHYHGGPIWGGDELIKALYMNSGALVSFARPDQIKKITSIPCNLVLDNGAFSAWKSAKGNKTKSDWIKHWSDYYDFVGEWFSRIDFFIIPDVIEGSEEDNDKLLDTVPSWLAKKSVPVWHSVESIERLIKLCENYDRVAIGCCGPHGSIRSSLWRQRMEHAFRAIYMDNNFKTKIHGLRMLDGRALSQFPFSSADSTNVAVNVPKTESSFPEIKDKLHRTAILKAAIEKVSPPAVSEWIIMKERLYSNIYRW